MYIICPAQEVIQYTLPNHNSQNITSYYAGRFGGFTRTMESLKGMAHPAVWPNVKNHITTSLAVVKNLSDFAQELSQMYEHHAEELQLLVGNYRKKNADLRKDGSRGGSSMLQLWEGLLQEVEADSQAHGEIASVLGRTVSRHTLERTFYRKVQARKLLAHRESLDAIISKSEDTLSKCRQEYKAAFLAHIQAPSSNSSLAAYLDAHNTYVTQLHATNSMVDTYCRETLPELLTELEEVYGDLCTTLAEAIAQGAEIISNRAGAQSRRYYAIWGDSKAVDPTSDTIALVRASVVPSQPHPTHRLRLFTPPHSDEQEGAVAPLKNNLVTDRPASLQVSQGYDSLLNEADGLQAQIQHLQDSLSTMLRIQQRSIESSLFNKANEIQEDISMKRYELKTAQINLSAIKAKKELFAVKMEGEVGTTAERKMSTVSNASMKSKWLKAFKSLKTPPPSNGKEGDKDKRNGKEHPLASDNAHQFQEYTYKKITPCDVCSQVLRGHTRQGLKCRLCKMNVHLDCQERIGKCQTKSRLLRRQKSSSDIETRATPLEEEGLLAGRVARPGRSVSPGGTSSCAYPDHSRSPLGRSVTFKNPPEQNLGTGGLQPALQGLDTPDTTYTVLKTANEISTRNPVETRNRRNPSSHQSQQGHQPASSDNQRSGETRRRRLFGMKSFGVFSKSSAERAASLPETEQAQYASGTRPFGQPLVLGAASAPSTPLPATPSPRQTKKHL